MSGITINNVSFDISLNKLLINSWVAGIQNVMAFMWRDYNSLTLFLSHKWRFRKLCDSITFQMGICDRTRYSGYMGLNKNYWQIKF